MFPATRRPSILMMAPDLLVCTSVPDSSHTPASCSRGMQYCVLQLCQVFVACVSTLKYNMVYGQACSAYGPHGTCVAWSLLLYREPDLTRNPSGAQVLRVPSHTGNALLDREGVRRRPPIAKLHCKAFQFPVSCLCQQWQSACLLLNSAQGLVFRTLIHMRP